MFKKDKTAQDTNMSPLFTSSPFSSTDLVAVPADAHEEVVRLDVAVDEVFAVDVLHPADHLIGQHEDRLHRKLAGAEVEEILERGPQ